MVDRRAARRIMAAMTLPPSWQSLIDFLKSTADVSTVYGAPVTAHGRTLIPVARVAYGFGGGHGPFRLAARSSASSGGATAEESAAGGLGGGIAARPVGVVELGPDGARFIVFQEGKKLAAAAVAGFVLGVLIARCLSRRS